MSRARAFAATAFAATCFATVSLGAAADDAPPPPGYDTGTRVVTVVSVPGAPVVIDTAYVNLRDGSDSRHDSVNASCVRYRNVATETIKRVRFERRYFDAARHELGSDAVEDATTRIPDPNAKPGVVPVGEAYWVCTQTAIAYGAKVSSVVLRPVYVKFASNAVWQQPSKASASGTH
jgi:hypothetical protein